MLIIMFVLWYYKYCIKYCTLDTIELYKILFSLQFLIVFLLLLKNILYIRCKILVI